MFFLTANKSHDKILESVCWDLLTARKTWSDLFFEQTEIQEITEEWCKCGNNTCSRKSHSVFVTVFFLSSINFKLHMLSFCCPLVATGGLCFWNTPPRVVCHQYNVSGHSGLIFNTIVLLFYSLIWFLKILMWWRAVLPPPPQETGGKAWAYQQLGF